MKIFLVGTIEFTYHCANQILEQDGNLRGIVTLPPSDERYNSDYKDLGPVAEKHDIPLIRTLNINENRVKNQIEEWAPDIMFVFGYSQLIDEEILQLPDLGLIGSHPTLLPKGRGRHPLIWPLVKGHSKSGLTFFYMDEGTDLYGRGDRHGRHPLAKTVLYRTTRRRPESLR